MHKGLRATRCSWEPVEGIGRASIARLFVGGSKAVGRVVVLALPGVRITSFRHLTCRPLFPFLFEWILFGLYFLLCLLLTSMHLHFLMATTGKKAPFGMPSCVCCHLVGGASSRTQVPVSISLLYSIYFSLFLLLSCLIHSFSSEIVVDQWLLGFYA